MTDFRASIGEVVRAIRIDGRLGFSWYGAYSRVRPARLLREVRPDTMRRYLVSAIQHRLYTDFYQPGSPRPANRLQGTSYQGGSPGFIQELSRANASTGYWEPGWHVRGIEDGSILVEKSSLMLRVRRDACSTHIVGLEAKVKMPRELLKASPGFYLAFGNLPLEGGDGGNRILRVYFNLAPREAIVAVRELTSGLNARQLPFRLKTVNDPSQYERCDSLVLYLHRGDYAAAMDAWVKLVSSQMLRSPVPAFTKAVAEGVAIAEDPLDGSSFGLHRCGLLADGLVRSSEAGASSEASTLEIVEQHFADNGIDLAVPYLNLGSSDSYERLAISRPRRAAVRERLPQEPLDYLEASQSVGDLLYRAAIVSDGCATWIAHSPRTPHERRIATLGPDLYAGTSGVGLFLAELGHAAPSHEVRDLALWAIEHALTHLEDVEPRLRPGFYTGWLGIAYASARAGDLLGKASLIERAARLAYQATDPAPGLSVENDLLAGKAGAICGLLTLGRILEDSTLEARAHDYGCQLVRDATRKPEGWSWRSVANPEAVNLTGLSHGTAGIALALLELYRTSSGSDYLDAALEAFRYERSWYDPKARNWPDFRDIDRRPAPLQPLPSFTAWCHGAPGIALSRQRAVEILGAASPEAPGLLAEADAGLETTRRAVEASLTRAEPDLCLCHGLTGNTEVLLACGQRVSEHSGLAGQVASVAFSQWRGKGFPTSAGRRPDLMTGLAGVGHFYLRLSDPSVPSVLLLRPELFNIDIRVSPD